MQSAQIAAAITGRGCACAAAGLRCCRVVRRCPGDIPGPELRVGQVLMTGNTGKLYPAPFPLGSYLWQIDAVIQLTWKDGNRR